MNVNKVLTKNYENKTLGQSGKNEPKTNPIRTQTNPIKANLQRAQMNVSATITKEYGIILNWAIYPKQTQFKPKTNPISAVINAAIRPYCRRRTLAYYRRIRVYFPDDDDLLRTK